MLQKEEKEITVDIYIHFSFHIYKRHFSLSFQKNRLKLLLLQEMLQKQTGVCLRARARACVCVWAVVSAAHVKQKARLC